MKPPWMKPEYHKPCKYRMYTDNTGEEATLNADAARGNRDNYANMRN